MTMIILRWNSSVNGQSLLEYKKGVKWGDDGIHIKWNIHLHEEFKVNDTFILVDTDSNNAGIMAHGVIESSVYEGTYKGKPAKYIDILCLHAVKPGNQPIVQLSEVNEVLGHPDWSVLLPGYRLTQKQTDDLEKLINKALNKNLEGHPATVDVWINYFFQWGVAPMQKTITISWQDFVALTCGNPDRFKVKSEEYLAWISNPKTRFQWQDLEKSIDRPTARRLLGICDETCVACNVVRVK